MKVYPDILTSRIVHEWNDEEIVKTTIMNPRIYTTLSNCGQILPYKSIFKMENTR